MDFFDQIEALAKSASDKAGNVIEIGKLNSKIRNENDAIAERKLELGEFIWARYESGEQLDEATELICVQIQNHAAKIKELEREIQQLKGMAICQACEAAVDESSVFCPRCGAKIEQPEPETATAEAANANETKAEAANADDAKDAPED